MSKRLLTLTLVVAQGSGGAIVATASIAGLLAQSKPAPKPAASAAQAAKGPEAKLPPAVAAAFRKAYPNAVVKDAASEKEDGRVEWEIECVDGTAHRDVLYLADGTFLADEEQIAVAAVPAPVLAALKTRYPKASVTVYEKLTKPTGVSYEMQVKGVDVKEVEIAPDGTFINPKPAKK